MGRIWFEEHPDVSGSFDDLEILPKFVYIDVYDNSLGFSLTNKASNIGFGTDTVDNSKNLYGLIQETGTFVLEINTQSDGVHTLEIEIEHLNTTLVFRKLDFDFELQRVDDSNCQISDENSEALSTTFVSTDIIRIQMLEIDGSNLENDGFSCDDVKWSVEGVTANDGTANERDSGDEKIFTFIPSPINRPTTGSRSPNEPIRYNLSCSILGLKKDFELVQDEKDILRQEYVDYRTAWSPERNEIHREVGRWNTGNYNFIASQGINRFQEIWDSLLLNYNTLCSRNGVNSEGLAFSSSYRNPQRNKSVGSVLINSNHTVGHAMDIQIVGERTSQKWNFLHDAAEQIEGVNAICENGPTQISCGASNQSHVHVSW